MSKHLSFAKPREVKTQELRLQFAELARQITSTVGQDGANLATAKPLIDAFAARLTVENSRVNGLKEDVEGQVREATSRADWYKSWGMHYLQSLARAHLVQQCNNFKDPGVQVYGGDLFQDVRDYADEMFLKLPPPAIANRANIDMLLAMGFDESTAKAALAAAYDNMEMAAEYCMTGIPARPPPAPRTSAPRAAPAPTYDMRDYYNASGG